MERAGVLDEVLLILARMEYERQKYETMLEKERKNVDYLQKQIERWTLKRLNELPIIVQREQEACVTDITELHWHIAFHAKREGKLKTQIEVEEKFCSQLKQEIDDITKMTPLIEEKISLELKAIKLILDAQQETDGILLKARDKYADASSRNKLTHMKADKEIEEINEDLTNCRSSLAKAQ